ncbi:hypothetical protein Tco_0696727 [Tanacetum coccineum]
MTRHTPHLKLEVYVDLLHYEVIEVCIDLLHCEVIEVCVDLLHCEVIEVCVDLLHCEVIEVCVDLLHCEVIALWGIIWSRFHPLEESRLCDLVLCAREEMRILLSHLIFSFPSIFWPSVRIPILSSSLISSNGMTRFSSDRHFFRFNTWKDFEWPDVSWT